MAPSAGDSASEAPPFPPSSSPLPIVLERKQASQNSAIWCEKEGLLHQFDITSSAQPGDLLSPYSTIEGSDMAPAAQPNEAQSLPLTPDPTLDCVASDRGTVGPGASVAEPRVETTGKSSGAGRTSSPPEDRKLGRSPQQEVLSHPRKQRRRRSRSDRQERTSGLSGEHRKPSQPGQSRSRLAIRGVPCRTHGVRKTIRFPTGPPEWVNTKILMPRSPGRFPTRTFWSSIYRRREQSSMRCQTRRAILATKRSAPDSMDPEAKVDHLLSELRTLYDLLNPPKLPPFDG